VSRFGPLHGSDGVALPVANQHWECCWPQGQDALVVADVAAQSERILLAVHQPPPLRQMPVPLPGRRHEAEAQSREATQEDLLDQLIQVETREHTLVIPIVGVPGTGKSHLIKWLRAAIPPRRDLIIRHVPREGTSLPEVVRILLEGLEGGRFDEIRQSMDMARSDIASLEQAATRLALRIAELVQFGVASGWRRAAKVDDAVRESLCHPSVLPALLTDPACRAHLTRPGGPIHRLATDIVEGYRRPEEDEDEELGFRPADLSFTNANMRGAGQAARRAVLNLKMPGVIDAAVRILSDALDVAAADVIGLSSLSLTDVFADLRAELLRQKKQLVLLFEDMAIARGLQLDLVDALTTPAVRDGEQRLCTLRVALAITPTYWDEQAPETLATRISAWGGSMFSLDVPTNESDDVAPVLIGRYLNAARLSVASLQDNPASVSTAVPNACDQCPFDRRDECHALFGATTAGHGLFPLTPVAAATAARLSNRETFRPRMVLTHVVGPVIAERSRLNEGRFPASDGDIKTLVEGAIQRRAIHELSLQQLEAIEQAELSPADRSRAEAVLRIWGIETRPDPAALLQALGLPDLSASAAAEPRTPQPPAVPPEGPEPPRPQPPPEDERLVAVDQWAAGGIELKAGIARTLRRRLFDELRAGIRWEEIGFGQEAAFAATGLRGGEQTQMNLAVRIANTAGGGAVGTADPLVEIKPSVANARLLRGLLLRERHGSWDFPGGLDVLARLRIVVREAEELLVQRLGAGPFSRKFLSDAGQVLVLAAAALGIDTESNSDHPLTSALTLIGERPAEIGRSRAWSDFTGNAQQSYENVLDVIRRASGRRQGRGADITAIDLTLVDAKRLRRDPAGLRKPPVSNELRDLHQALLHSAEAALVAEAQEIEGVINSIETHIGAGASLTLKSIKDAFYEAVEVAKASHVLRPAETLEEVEEMKLPSSTAAAQLLDDARRAVIGAKQGVSVDSLERIARLDVTTLLQIAHYLTCLDRVVTESMDAAREVIEANATGANGGSSGPVREAVRAAIADVEQLLQAVDGGAS
jgi:hypothetical protein